MGTVGTFIEATVIVVSIQFMSFVPLDYFTRMGSFSQGFTVALMRAGKGSRKSEESRFDCGRACCTK